MAELIVPKSVLNPEAAPFQPLETLCTQSAALAADKSDRPSAFLNLPPEVRDMIYDELLRPDLKSFYNPSYQGKRQNAVGCTNILLLNRQTYSEAIAFVQVMRNSIVLKRTSRRFFRHPLAHGKPSFFHSFARCSTTFVPDSLSELEFINLRNVTIIVLERSTREDIAEIFQAIKKSHTLKQIELICQLCFASQGKTEATYVSDRWNVVKELKASIRPLIGYCVNNGIKLTASDNHRVRNQECRSGAPRVFNVSDYRDPLVAYINARRDLQTFNRRIDQATQNANDNKHSKPPRAFQLNPECLSQLLPPLRYRQRTQRPPRPLPNPRQTFRQEEIQLGPSPRQSRWRPPCMSGL